MLDLLSIPTGFVLSAVQEQLVSTPPAAGYLCVTYLYQMSLLAFLRLLEKFLGIQILKKKVFFPLKWETWSID